MIWGLRVGNKNKRILQKWRYLHANRKKDKHRPARTSSFFEYDQSDLNLTYQAEQHSALMGAQTLAMRLSRAQKNQLNFNRHLDNLREDFNATYGETPDKIITRSNVAKYHLADSAHSSFLSNLSQTRV